MNRKRLIREQLDASLRRFAPLRDVTPPAKGWVRAIRDALGMTARQLAGRLGIAQQAVARIERDELSGSVTVKTMRRLAEGLDCVFVCGFVPRSSLDDTLRKQAALVAAKRLARASQTMRLEDQSLSATENDRMRSEMVDELVATSPSSLWSEA
jgi:predicted DNA-binding mobile mystery protein A